MSAERWAKRFVARPAAERRVFCFPYASAGASAFRRWMNLFPPHIEVIPIEYPGRWTRSDEPLCDSIERLAEGAAEALAPLLDRPCAVMGYSFGALVAFEFMRRVGSPEARGFFPCAQRAPHLPVPAAAIHDLPDLDLVAAMEKLYGSPPGPPVDPDLLARALGPLRADLRARQMYSYVPGPRLAVPIYAIGGGRRRHRVGGATGRLGRAHRAALRSAHAARRTFFHR